MRLSSLVLLAAFSQAPLQCSHEDDPSLRRYETPPEALYELAQRFKSKGELSPYRETLGYLIERYPSSRFAMRAKDELGSGADAAK